MAKVKASKCEHPTWNPNTYILDPLTGEEYVLMVCCECYERKRWVMGEKLADPLDEHISDEA